MLFQSEGWHIQVRSELVVYRPYPRIHALQFLLRADQPTYLTCFLDEYGNAAGLQPLDDGKTLLDVEAGDEVMRPCGDDRYTIDNIFVFRSFPAYSNDRPVQSGRWFLEEHATGI